jgi:hypothetical protein
MAAHILDKLARVQAAHDALTPATQIGRRIGLTAKPTTRPS